MCVKIGITKGKTWKDALKRSSGFKGYEIRIQKLVQGTLQSVNELEFALHEKYKAYKYTSEWAFGGHQELFQLDKLSDILADLAQH